MKNKLILLLVAAGSALLVTGCIVRHSREHSREPVVAASYAYVYYPEVEVYFEPHRHVYYWSERGTWRSGRRVPRGIVLRSHVSVNLDSVEPYRHHDEVRSKYPRRQLEDRRDQNRDQR